MINQLGIYPNVNSGLCYQETGGNFQIFELQEFSTATVVSVAVELLRKPKSWTDRTFRHTNTGIRDQMTAPPELIRMGARLTADPNGMDSRPVGIADTVRRWLQTALIEGSGKIGRLLPGE